MTDVARAKRPRIVVHVGSHKSGTTAVQQWISANGAALERAQIAVPAALLNRGGNGADLAKALSASALHATAEDRDLLERFTTFVGGSRSKTIFFSAEAFETSITEGGIANVADRLRAIGLRKKAAVLIIRNQIDALNSEYSQRRKRLMTVRPGEDALDMVFARDRKDWFMQRKTLVDHGFDARLGVYRGRDPEMPIARQVMTLAGLADQIAADVSFDTDAANESIGELGCVAAQHLTSLLDQRGAAVSDSDRRWVSNLLIRACNEFTDQPYNGFDEAVRVRIAAQFAASNQQLAPYLGGGDSEVQRLLQTRAVGRDKSPETWTDLTPLQRETVVAMLETVADLLDAKRKGRKILLREDFLAAIPERSGKRLRPAGDERVKNTRQELMAKRSGKALAQRPKPPGKRRPGKKWVKDPLWQRLTFARIKASLWRRVKALVAKR